MSNEWDQFEVEAAVASFVLTFETDENWPKDATVRHEIHISDTVGCASIL